MTKQKKKKKLCMKFFRVINTSREEICKAQISVILSEDRTINNFYLCCAIFANSLRLDLFSRRTSRTLSFPVYNANVGPRVVLAFCGRFLMQFVYLKVIWNANLWERKYIRKCAEKTVSADELISIRKHHRHVLELETWRRTQDLQSVADYWFFWEPLPLPSPVDDYIADESQAR